MKENNNSEQNTKIDPKNKDLGVILVEKGLISDDQLQVAKKQMAITGKSSLGELLVNMGFVTESALGEAISKTSGIEKFDLKSIVLDARLIKKIPKEIALKHKVITVGIEPKKIFVAIHDVYDVIALDSVKKFFPSNFTIEPLYSPDTEILEVIDQYYDYDMSMDGILKEIENVKEGFDNASAGNNENYKNPVVRLVDSILIDAVHINASDIHFEPEESFLRLRYRVDGKMRQIKAFHKDYWPSIAVRIKIMSSMNIAESRKSQDGHATANVLGREVNFRVATQPTVHGENIVMRILDKAKSLVELDKLGYSEHNIKLLTKLLKKPEGIIVVTGPTGSGKTTTLYSVLSYINSVDKNIMTLEDPVEYEIPLIRQTSVKDGSISFVDGIKSLLRQDPDVIFVGEVRDSDTASIAVRAAMTGHQVFTTLHTNDAVGVISRLSDIGVKHSLLSGALICCLAQRLIRILCVDCKVKEKARPDECEILGIDPSEGEEVYHAAGCDKCGNTGYKGRVAVSEILAISREIDEMIALGSTANAILTQANKEGFVSMAQDALSKVMQGITDVDEVIRNIDMLDRL
ncbi:MAG: Flp pilus assembly complex ATPase component TadA [Alphaproteobacteria bacterium]|nr:Flp pilus assembly complex ATPase component TadA [Alphaproteobacteria bacterium]